MKVTVALTLMLSSTSAQAAHNFTPISKDNKCQHAPTNCMVGDVCAGPFSSESEWTWYVRNQINEDSTADEADNWNGEYVDAVDDVRFWDYEAGNAHQSDPSFQPTWRYLCIPDWKCGEMVANPTRATYTPAYGGSLNLVKQEVYWFDPSISGYTDEERWQYGEHTSYNSDERPHVVNDGQEAGDLGHSWLMAYDALSQWPEFSGQAALPAFSCQKSQYSGAYLGETCDINSDCSISHGLSCAYNDEDPSDQEVKTCIETARCYTDIPLHETAWYVCDSAIKMALSAALLLTVTATSL